MLPGSGLPPQCELHDNVLVFFEVAGDAVLDNGQFIYDHTCYTACTNGLRPAGVPEVHTFEFPPIGDDQLLKWGGRAVSAADAREWAAQGMRLVQFRLPVAPMLGGAPMPPSHPPTAIPEQAEGVME